MKKTRKDSSGDLPSAQNRKEPTSSVATMAMSGAVQRINCEGWARGSSRCMGGLRLGGGDIHIEETRHFQADRFCTGSPPGLGTGELPLGEYGNPVTDLEQFLELFGDDQNGDAGTRQVNQFLAQDGRCADIDAPGGLGDDHD